MLQCLKPKNKQSLNPILLLLVKKNCNTASLDTQVQTHCVETYKPFICYLFNMIRGE